MKKIVLTLAALMVLSPIAALAQDQPKETAMATFQAPASDAGSAAVPDYVILEIAGQ